MATSELAQKECIPCKGGVDPLKGDELKKLQSVLGNDWDVVNEHHLEKQYKLKDWAQAMKLANAISEIAEDQNHHPDLEVSYGSLKVTIFTHKIDGLTESDFVFAAKVEEASKGI